MQIPHITKIAHVRRRPTPPGIPPGTLQPPPSSPHPTIRVIAFNDGEVHEKHDASLENVRAMVGRWPVTWVNVDGLGDEKTLSSIGDLFGLHRLALEDVVNVHQRPKVEQYEDHLFVVLRMISMNDGIESEQISLFLGQNFVLTFQETAGDCFDPVRQRIRRRAGRVRQSGADYLAYALIDAVVDYYFPVLEHYGDSLDELERQVLTGPTSAVVQHIYGIRKDLLVLRRAAWPTREAVNALLRDETPFITDTTRTYLRDCYDHTVHILEMLEHQREITSSLTELYMSSVGNRMNEVMKVLAVIATVFMPLSFIAGLYGMNFDPDASPWNMPELRWYLGYPLTLGLMAAVVVGQLIFFRRRGWIDPTKPEQPTTSQGPTA